jgi:hypothetical protein
MSVTLDPEHFRALWGGIAGLTFFLALALWRLRRAKRPLPAGRDHPAPSLPAPSLPAPSFLARAAKASGLPPPLAYPIFTLALALLGLGLVGAVTVVAATILQTLTQGAAAASLGAGALIAALLAAPFLLWRSLVAQRTVNIAQESHITDLIAKAVEQLGAEKTVDRIGRPVTVWTGGPTQQATNVLEEQDFVLPPRSREVMRGTTSFVWMDEEGYSHESYPTVITYDTWPLEETRIEWRGEPPPISGNEVIATTGAWQVFSETNPNLEVRIGAILALERLARQNLDVHVQIMEILTAYIRENAKAKDAPKLPEPPQYTPDDHASWRNAFYEWREALRNALADIRPREDIQKALSVIGRRSPEQRTAEARWQNPDPEAHFVFDVPPAYPAMPKRHHDVSAHAAWEKLFNDWDLKSGLYSCYRIDLRNTNLQGAVLSGLNLAGAQLDKALMQGSELNAAQIQGAQLVATQMQGARLVATQMQGARLDGAQMQGASLHLATMQGARLAGVQMQSATLYSAQMQGARHYRVKVDDATSFSDASLSGARLREVDFRPYPTLLASIANALPTLFADASVLLPDTHPRPAHWPTWVMDELTFGTEYAKWLASPSTYTPPPPP